MVDFGPRTALAMWFVSVACQIGFWLGVCNINFWGIWTWATILDKSYKLITSQMESDFLDWGDNVVSSVFNLDRNNNRANNQQQQQQVELPIIRA